MFDFGPFDLATSTLAEKTSHGDLFDLGQNSSPPPTLPSSVAGKQKWGPEGWEAQHFAHSSAHATIFFLLSLGGPSDEIWGCLKRRGPEMCAFGVFGLSCETPEAQQAERL